MKNVTIITLGCKVNQCESAALACLLEASGYRPSNAHGRNDLVVINTCAVTGKAAMQSRQAIRQAVRNHPGAKIVVTGCYAQTAPEQIRRIEGVDCIVGHGDKLNIPAIVDRIGLTASEPALVHHDIFEDLCFAPLPSVAPETRTRAFLKIQDGCDAFCTYCIVPHARGRSRSMPAEDVRTHIRMMADQGFREIVLTGIHLGAYGKDLEPQTSLPSLLSSIEGQYRTVRIRISSIEPTEVEADLVNLIAAPESTLCPHLHIPLQSGDNGILKRMARPYGRERFAQTIADIHRALPYAAIGADVLVGFPGENQSAFDNTYALIDQLPVSYLHVFPFSPRKGTPAAGFKAKVRESIIKERCARLRQLSEEKKALFYHSNIGRVVDVLVETVQSGYCRGLSENYIPVLIPGSQHTENSVVKVCIDRVEPDLTVVGKLV